MPQYNTGLVRVQNASTTVQGSHKSTVNIISGTFAAADTLAFSPSSAAGIFMSEVNGILRYVVTSGTPAAGDTVTATPSGAQRTVLDHATETLWVTESIDNTHQFALVQDGVHRNINAVTAEDRITLDSAPGIDNDAATYGIVRDFSFNQGYPLLTPGDTATITIMRRAIEEIDEDMPTAGVDPGPLNTLTPRAGAWQTVAGYSAIQYYKVHKQVTIQGVVQTVTSQNRTSIITTLPADHKPPARLIFGSQYERIDVLATTGDIIFMGDDGFSGWLPININYRVL